MNFLSPHFRRLPWLNLPGALLVALLQRTPVVRVTATAGEMVFASPAGAVLRAAAATVASLGALHTLAGATSQVVVSSNSVNITVGTPLIPPVSFVTNFFPPSAFTVGSYLITGLPPGLTVPGLNTATNFLNITNSTGAGQITGTPNMEGSYPVTLQAWEFGGASASGSFTQTVTILFTVTPSGATGPPKISAQPVSLVTVVGQSVTFSVGVTANPSASYQWLKNSVSIPNATGASYTIGDVKLTDAANYVVNVTNSFGTVTSAAATLNVNSAADLPRFTVQPQSQTVAAGSTVVLTAAAGGAPTPTYQWWRGRNSIAGATGTTLVLSGANVIAGTYSVVATNDAGPVTSNSATLTVTNPTDPGRLINLSILTALTAGETLTMGTAIGGNGTTGTKPLLARAAGPSLTQLGVNNVLPDPRLSLVTFPGNVTVAANNDWGLNAAALAAAFAQVGAFPYIAVSSKDAAIFLQSLDRGNYTVQVGDNATGAGTVIAELYDATPSGSFAPPTARLINVSVRKQIAAGATLTAGFVIGGKTDKTVLVRAIGPGLAPFGVVGTMADPRLTLFNASSVKIAENDNWGGDAQLTTVGRSVGAFAIDDTASRDAMLLITLAPGNYSAAVSPLGGGGEALVEVYEVP